jgi:hypothetical protein
MSLYISSSVFRDFFIPAVRIPGPVFFSVPDGGGREEGRITHLNLVLNVKKQWSPISIPLHIIPWYHAYNATLRRVRVTNTY